MGFDFSLFRPRHIVGTKRLRRVVPQEGARLLYCDHVEHDGEGLFRLACDNDLEGIVAKRMFDPYLPEHASWLKIRN
jgi:ATP-dependent DNA ligase